MLLLALDTSTPAVTVALHDGAAVVSEVSAVDARRHGELLSAFVDEALRKAGAGFGDLTAIAAGIGPGPYTGLRAGVVTARVLGSALAIRTDGICSLDVIAAQAVAGASRGRTVEVTGSDFLVVTDARRREVYWARYRPDGERVAGPLVSRPVDLPAGLPVAGEAGLLPAELASPVLEPRYPSAVVLANLAVARLLAGVPPDLAEPLYLRRPDAREPGPPKRVTA
ncbi:MAG TPA: tRNA (adenosine(37)-N6)-threonylcarbamoyltransferase complex dimerization subunit type 1 TsaB [Streptosporangiaceae bacterium]|nr:tRNA (adenosine(37)-N6)-threonylcarbamoyltransferase complex dimerization subunit type 1 TsaB [Streptosporangiaceae bacterium]